MFFEASLNIFYKYSNVYYLTSAIKTKFLPFLSNFQFLLHSIFSKIITGIAFDGINFQ